MSETIFALSSGGLPSGVAVIRISGPEVRFVLETMCGILPDARAVALRTINDGTGDPIDQGLVIFFPGRSSFTGEDCGELHLHGGRAVVHKCLLSLGNMPGLRLAEPGEFTRRAFENGKMDLTEAEGLADLIRAETEMQRRAALDQAGGHQRLIYEAWMKRLTHARAMLEAELDFADEDDIPGSVSDRVWEDLKRLNIEIADHLAGLRWGELVREGFRIALVGAPNVGKSSLLNRLADRDVAIVSSIPGTTRDLVEVRLDLGGHLVLVQDTAGLREFADEIELEGMRRSRKAIEAANLVLLLDDGISPTPAADYEDIQVWPVRTKLDLMEGDARSDEPEFAISALTGEGVDKLIAAISAEIERTAHSGELGLPNRERHRIQLKACGEAVMEALARREGGIEIVGESLRTASLALGRITGHVDVEDLLGVIFSEFCVGK